MKLHPIKGNYTISIPRISFKLGKAERIFRDFNLSKVKEKLKEVEKKRPGNYEILLFISRPRRGGHIRKRYYLIKFN
jgi:hypothetical protein